jgi:hypothetical protein
VQGYFVDPSCSSALWYLRGVADSVMASAEEHGDMVLPRAPVRLRERERDASAAINDLLDLDAPDQVKQLLVFHFFYHLSRKFL